ncbi:hypothetical protein [Streptomyces mirabilis]|uniref:hypothetical protein n=1 Tax=Streptomyces mirabilis TaxID=68239 RepID=UPI0033FB4C01
MTTTAWPFGTDADEKDPLTAMRIPVVGSFNPMWKYVAAYLNTAGDGPDYLQGPPFASNERPTDAEAQMIASFIQAYIQHWFRESYQAKLARRLLDVDSGCKTIVFIKYGPDDWGYRVTEWQYGHTFVPPPPSYRERRPDEDCGGPLTLEQVMDRKHTIVDEPMQHWLDWKAAHPEVFPT